MIEIFSVPSRQYNNRTFTTNLARLSQHVAMPDFWFVLCRLEITAVNPGAVLTVHYEMRSGGGVILGDSTNEFRTIGRREIAFSRSDLDDLSNISLFVNLAGRMNLSAGLYVAEHGEDILPWQ